MKKLILLLLFIPLISLCQEEEITLKTKTGDIKGSLLVPSSSKKASVVLIISGSGPTDRNGNNPIMINNSLMMLANELKKNGIASVRFDKRGIGESKNSGLEESDLRFENYVNDVKGWIDLLKESNRFSEIIVLGHSEGALIGMIASQKIEVEKFISVAGAGNSAGDIIREQLKAQPPVVLNQSLPIIEKLENGETVENVPQMLYALFRPSVQPYMISWLKYNPQIEIAKLNKPVLIIQGTTDIQVSVSDADKLALANKKAKKQIIEGMNHILKEAELDRQKNIQTYSMPDLPLKKDLIEFIVKFIKE
ncbi:MAG: alpha/beta hydrolase [Flavobacteriaceae bacterium]|nr:alpha/beta hydrolase [Flavobacteriaceae bacterium]